MTQVLPRTKTECIPQETLEGCSLSDTPTPPELATSSDEAARCAWRELTVEHSGINDARRNTGNTVLCVGLIACGGIVTIAWSAFLLWLLGKAFLWAWG